MNFVSHTSYALLYVMGDGADGKGKNQGLKTGEK